MIAASTQSNLFQSSRSAQMAWFNFLLEILRERPLLFLPSTTTLPHFAILYDVISFYRQFLPYTQCAKIFKNIRPLLSVSIKTFFSKIRTRDPIRIGLDHQWLKDCNFWCVTFMKAEKFHQCSMSHEESNSIVGL